MFREGNRQGDQMTPMGSREERRDERCRGYFAAQTMRSRATRASRRSGRLAVLAKKFNCSQCHGLHLLASSTSRGSRVSSTSTQGPAARFKAQTRADIDGT